MYRDYYSAMNAIVPSLLKFFLKRNTRTWLFEIKKITHYSKYANVCHEPSRLSKQPRLMCKNASEYDNIFQKISAGCNVVSVSIAFVFT